MGFDNYKSTGQLIAMPPSKLMHTTRLGRSHRVRDADQHNTSRFVVQTVDEFAKILIFGNNNSLVLISLLENGFIIGSG